MGSLRRCIKSVRPETNDDRMGQRCPVAGGAARRGRASPADHGSGFGGVTRTRMLLQLQRTFAARLLGGKAKGTSPDGLRVDALGFGVHANNTRVSLRIAVENVYPVTRRLVGADFFTAGTPRFVGTPPPHPGCVSARRARLPDIVAPHPPPAAFRRPADRAPGEPVRHPPSA